MSVSSAAPTSQQQRIPAWKRLGLKLKYAKDNLDTPEQTTNKLELVQNGYKRPAEQVENKDAKRAKKREKFTNRADQVAHSKSASLDALASGSPLIPPAVKNGPARGSHQKFDDEVYVLIRKLAPLLRLTRIAPCATRFYHLSPADESVPDPLLPRKCGHPAKPKASTTSIGASP
jgi:hypothetical protein